MPQPLIWIVPVVSKVATCYELSLQPDAAGHRTSKRACSNSSLAVVFSFLTLASSTAGSPAGGVASTKLSPGAMMRTLVLTVSLCTLLCIKTQNCRRSSRHVTFLMGRFRNVPIDASFFEPFGNTDVMMDIEKGNPIVDMNEKEINVRGMSHCQSGVNYA